MTVEEVGKLLGGTEEPHMQLFILLLLAAAARSEPILTLTWAQVDLGAGLIRLNPEGVSRPASGGRSCVSHRTSASCWRRTGASG